MGKDLFEGMDIYEYVKSHKPPEGVHQAGTAVYNAINSVLNKTQPKSPAFQPPKYDLPPDMPSHYDRAIASGAYAVPGTPKFGEMAQRPALLNTQPQNALKGAPMGVLAQIMPKEEIREMYDPNAPTFERDYGVGTGVDLVTDSLLGFVDRMQAKTPEE